MFDCQGEGKKKMSQNLLSNLFRFRVSLAVQKGEEEEKKRKRLQHRAM